MKKFFQVTSNWLWYEWQHFKKGWKKNLVGKFKFYGGGIIVLIVLSILFGKEKVEEARWFVVSLPLEWAPFVAVGGLFLWDIFKFFIRRYKNKKSKK